MLTLDTHVTDGEIVVTLRGELDLAEADAVGEAISQAVDATTGTVVIDLAHLTFCDSTGSDSLRCRVRVLRRGGAWSARCGCPRVRQGPRSGHTTVRPATARAPVPGWPQAVQRPAPPVVRVHDRRSPRPPGLPQ